ncbi:hypothetical protein ACFFX0_24305 [Citricoccus parietis]|uniref:Uncharacterized protein n=1 Tax=Citricoccus parietis TaxID=592307 RepID=A0ABV5G5B9_9MICC
MGAQGGGAESRRDRAGPPPGPTPAGPRPGRDHVSLGGPGPHPDLAPRGTGPGPACGGVVGLCDPRSGGLPWRCCGAPAGRCP